MNQPTLAAAPPPPRRLASRKMRRVANRIIVFHGLSSFCWGLVFPYTAIYISDLPGIGTGGVAFYFGMAGGANLVLAAVLTLGLVRPPRVALGVLGCLLSFTGYLVLPAVASLPLLGVAAVANGAGQGAFLAAVIPIMNSLVDERHRRRLFARRYQVLNATLASGSMVAGLVVTALSRDVIPYLFVVNAVGYLPIAATLALTRKMQGAAQRERSEREAEAARASLSVAGLVKASLAVTLFQLGAYLLGYSQFEATVPLVVDKLMRVGLGWVSVVLTVNVAVIVLAQDLVTKLLERRSEVFGLRVAVGLWVGAYVLAGALSLTDPALALAGVLTYAVLFALGECAYSCSYHPWLISRVPEHELTRANAMSNSMMGIGLLTGPTIGVALLSAGSAPVVWFGLAGLTSMIMLSTLTRRRSAAAAGA